MLSLDSYFKKIGGFDGKYDYLGDYFWEGVLTGEREGAGKFASSWSKSGAVIR